jgi:malonyl-CoA O-methyltransferase
MQRRDGAIPAVAKGCWGDHALLAHLAAIWYRLGERDPADLALAQLARHQLQSGGWHESWGRGERVRESAWVVKHYLDAAQWQVHSSFSAELTALPQTIAADDGRLRAVEQWMTGFAAGEKVADVGCGPGRFVRILRERFPQVRLVGIDPAEAMLSRLPAQVEARRGGLLHLPGRAGEFAGALAVESLEHALLPEKAVAELCRVVRPGGRLLIIDKDVRFQPLSLCQPWERWFLPEEVSAWLAPYCDEVTVRGVSHGPNERGNGLFLCWQARRT